MANISSSATPEGARPHRGRHTPLSGAVGLPAREIEGCQWCERGAEWEFPCGPRGSRLLACAFHWREARERQLQLRQEQDEEQKQAAFDIEDAQADAYWGEPREPSWD